MEVLIREVSSMKVLIREVSSIMEVFLYNYGGHYMEVLTKVSFSMEVRPLGRHDLSKQYMVFEGRGLKKGTTYYSLGVSQKRWLFNWMYSMISQYRNLPSSYLTSKPL